MRKALIRIAAALLLGLATMSAGAVTIYRDYEIDLTQLSYVLIPDGVTWHAYIYLPVDPFVFTGVGDQLVTTVRFANRQRLRLIDGEGASERVQLQYGGPSPGAQGTHSTQRFELLDVTGNYNGLPEYVYQQGFGCGNCLIGFTLGSDLTASQFSFRGVRMTTTVDQLTPGGPYTWFFFLTTAHDFAIRPVPEPGTFALLFLGLAGLGAGWRSRDRAAGLAATWLAVLMGSSAVAAPAGIYWADSTAGTIEFAGLDGSNPQTLVSGLAAPQGILVGEYLLWADRDDQSIWRAELDGSSAAVVVSAAPGRPRDVGVNGGYIYWVATLVDSISRADEDGSNVAPLVTTDLSFPNGIAVTSEHLYWSDSGKRSIRRSGLDGAGVVEVVGNLPSTQLPNDVFVTEEHVYWSTRDLALTQGGTAQPGTIQRANLDGSGLTILVDNLVFPQQVAVTGSFLYWTDEYTGKIQRANLDGSGVTDLLTGLPGPVGLAVVEGVIEVSVDIKPGGYPNSINPSSRGLTAVAVLTTSRAQGESLDFDASQLDGSTVTFGPGDAAPAREARVEDADGDGDADLLLHFRTADTGLGCGDSSAELTGLTWSGEAVSGEDSVRIVPCR